MRLADIMTRKVETIGTETPAREAWDRMKAARIRHLVVVRGSTVVGILSERDLGGARGAETRRDRRVSDLMSTHVATLPPDATIRQAANLLRGRVIGCIPVVAGGKTVGIVTITDLLDLLGRGTEKAVPKTRRWTLRQRGPRPMAVRRG